MDNRNWKMGAGSVEKMIRYNHFFSCPQCDEVSVFASDEKITKESTYETSCSCGIMTHTYLKTKIVEK